MTRDECRELLAKSYYCEYARMAELETALRQTVERLADVEQAIMTVSAWLPKGLPECGGIEGTVQFRAQWVAKRLQEVEAVALEALVLACQPVRMFDGSEEALCEKFRRLGLLGEEGTP